MIHDRDIKAAVNAALHGYIRSRGSRTLRAIAVANLRDLLRGLP